MPSAPSGIAFTIEQLASFLAWSTDRRHALAAAVRCNYVHFEEVIEIRRADENSDLFRWLVHRAPDGTLFVVAIGADSWEAMAASAEEAQLIIELDHATECAEYRTGQAS